MKNFFTAQGKASVWNHVHCLQKNESGWDRHSKKHGTSFTSNISLVLMILVKFPTLQVRGRLFW